MRIKCKSDAGFTMTEVIITIAILSVVTLALFRFLSFGIDSFNLGIDTIEEQSELRMTAYRLVDHVRNIRQVNMLTDPATYTLAEGIKYDGANQEIIYTDATGDILLSRGDISSLALTIMDDAAILNTEERAVLQIDIVGENKTFSTSVLLNNMYVADFSALTGNAIEFDHNP